MTSQKPTRACRCSAGAPLDQGPQVRFKTFPEVVGNHIVMRGQRGQNLQDLIAYHGGELDGDSEQELFLDGKETEVLLRLAAPIYFSVNGREWVLNHNERTGWVLCTGL